MQDANKHTWNCHSENLWWNISDFSQNSLPQRIMPLSQPSFCGKCKSVLKQGTEIRKLWLYFIKLHNYCIWGGQKHTCQEFFHKSTTVYSRLSNESDSEGILWRGLLLPFPLSQASVEHVFPCDTDTEYSCSVYCLFKFVDYFCKAWQKENKKRYRCIM